MQKILAWFTPSKKSKPEKKKGPNLPPLPPLGKQGLVFTENKDSFFTFTVHDVVQNEMVGCNWVPAEQMFRKQAGCRAKLEDFSWETGFEGNLIGKEMDGVLNALHYAYIHHHPIKLSVSDFILMIGQGLAKHLEIHAEDLRKHFVDFEGKEKIEILRSDLVPGEKNDWSTVFGEFSEAIKKRVKTDFYDVVIDDTSVATKITRISSEIALMDVYKQYFEYVVSMGCGFPKMTLVGTPDDWEMLRTKVRRLKELNDGDKLKLDWWLDHLVPLVETMVDQAKSRNVDPSFWGSIYHSQEHGFAYSPTPLISGWIKVFQPYLQRGEENDPTGERKSYRSTFGEIHPSNLITGVSKVPFTWSGSPMNFYGGFLGAKMLEDGAIEPIYFYAVAYDK